MKCRCSIISSMRIARAQHIFVSNLFSFICCFHVFLVLYLIGNRACQLFQQLTTSTSYFSKIQTKENSNGIFEENASFQYVNVKAISRYTRISYEKMDILLVRTKWRMEFEIEWKKVCFA